MSTGDTKCSEPHNLFCLFITEETSYELFDCLVIEVVITCKNRHHSSKRLVTQSTRLHSTTAGSFRTLDMSLSTLVNSGVASMKEENQITSAVAIVAV